MKLYKFYVYYKIISKLIYKLNMEMLLITATTSGKGELMIHIQWGRVAIR